MPASVRVSALIGLLAMITACSSSADQTTSANSLTTIEALDVPRYMGIWYEIAKYPNWFQKKCVGNTSADYSLQSDGTVRVVNRCRLESGEMTEAVGTARQVGPAKLEVRFAPWWLSWLPAVWGNYWVVDIDPGYQLVAVSEPKREYLWILSRTQRVDPVAYQALLGRLQTQGFNMAKLEVILGSAMITEGFFFAECRPYCK